MSAANIHVTSVYVFLENYLYTDKTKGGFFWKILNMKPHSSYIEWESQFECFASVPSTIVLSLLLKQRKQMHPEKMCINKNCPGKLSVKAKL